MKKIFSFKESKFLQSAFIAISVLLFPMQGYSYVVAVINNNPPNVVIYDETASWNVVSNQLMTLAGFTMTGATTITLDPTSGFYYAAVNISGGGQARRLVTVDPATGICTDIGLMGAISSMTCSPGGTLYAIGGHGGGAIAERLYSVNKNNAVLTFLGGPYSLAADGEIIAYNSTDDFIYHWSGNSSNAMEKINSSTFVATTITQSGAPHFEIFGAVYKGNGEFYAADIAEEAFIITAAGACILIDTVLDATRGFAYEQGVFPVELSSFSSTVTGNNVTLNWSTVTETNNSGFEIQRSQSQIWERAGYVTGNGTSNAHHSYSFVDRNLNSGVYYYRLKQIDYNGSYEYHNLSNEVVIGAPEKFELSQNYPNPFNPTTKIEFGIPDRGGSESESGHTSLKIYDALGNEIATLVNENKSPGRYSVNFDASNLSSGIYFYKLTSGNFSEVKKMTLLK